jgi:hypothetical protein
MSHFFDTYKDHSSTLRTWLVAYGVGAPAVILSNSSLWQRVHDSHLSRYVGVCFLLGVSLQVALAALNKTIMWALYFGEDNPIFRKKRRYRIADTLSEMFWLDFALDLLTIALFSRATYVLFGAVA